MESDFFDSILNGEPDVIEIETLPELAEINDAMIISTYKDIRLTVVDITVDDATIFEVTDYTGKISKFIKYLENAKKESVKELKEQIKTKEQPFKNLISEVDKLNGMLRSKLLEYQKEKKRKEEERLKAEKDQQIKELEQAREATGDEETKQALDKAVKHVASQEIVAKSSVQSIQATSSVVTYWKYDITDPDLVCRHHPELCEPSRSKINAQVQKLKKDAVDKFQGIRVYSKDDIRVR